MKIFAGEAVVAPAPAASEFAASLKSHAEGAAFRVICIMHVQTCKFSPPFTISFCIQKNLLILSTKLAGTIHNQLLRLKVNMISS